MSMPDLPEPASGPPDIASAGGALAPCPPDEAWDEPEPKKMAIMMRAIKNRMAVSPLFAHMHHAPFGLKPGEAASKVLVAALAKFEGRALTVEHGDTLPARDTADLGGFHAGRAD